MSKSESVEMYLVMTAMLRRGKQPVPLSRLAENLSISPVSTNEMCRKLVEKGLIEYQPYKGVTLTTEGNAVAQRVLRRRRLWETFLIEKLSIEQQEADAIACQLEHVSSDNLTERLALFLEQSPQVAPHLFNQQNQNAPANLTMCPLSSLTAGQHGRIITIAADDVVRDFLRAQGLTPGVSVDVLAIGTDGSMLLEMSEHCVSLSRTVAEHIDVAHITMKELEEASEEGKATL